MVPDGAMVAAVVETTPTANFTITSVPALGHLRVRHNESG
jgi:hypothetical protein